jgi:hypothetical protein
MEGEAFMKWSWNVKGNSQYNPLTHVSEAKLAVVNALKKINKL